MRKRTIGLTMAAVMMVGIGLAHAQSNRAHRRPARQASQAPFSFGGVELSGFTEMKYIPGKSVVAEGPNLTVDSVDKETGAKSQLLARKITASMGKGFTADRIDATGNVRFNGTRPIAGGKGSQVFNGSGSRATFFRQQGRLVLDGPVSYFAEQPVEGQTSKQWVRGTASEAIYDEKARTLTLTGSVKAKAFDPESMPDGKPADIVADKIIIDMAKQPYEYRILNNNPSSGQISIPIKQQPKKP